MIVIALQSQRLADAYIWAVRQSGSWTPTQMAKGIGVNRDNVSRIIKSLRSRGLIVRHETRDNGQTNNYLTVIPEECVP